MRRVVAVVGMMMLCALAGASTAQAGVPACTMTGTSGNDTMFGTPFADVICGLGGNDTLIGLDGNDILVGGPGDERSCSYNTKDIRQDGANRESI